MRHGTVSPTARRISRRVSACVMDAALMVTLLCASLARADWPTYRHDASRSGWSSEPIPMPLQLQWQYQSSVPLRPAWPAPASGNVYQNLASLNKWDISDHAMHAVAADGLVVFGSSVDDTVYGLQLRDGKEKWKCFADAPVRMPPTIAGGKVYAASDDGIVYCIEAASGKTLWSHRVGPENRWLPGNSRMISRWPVRAGPLVHDGQVLVAAGVFPLEGMFLTALDPQDGHSKWMQSLDVVAHGPMVASTDRVFVSGLRGNPTIFELHTGKFLGSLPGTGPFAAFGRGQFVAGPSETGVLAGVEKEVQQALAVRDGFQVVMSEDRMVAASNQVLAAFDSQLRMLWKMPRAQTCALIVAGDTVFAGGDGEVTAYELENGNLCWQHSVAGKSLGLSAADNCLVVSTDRGEVVCFSSAKPAVAETDSQLPRKVHPIAAEQTRRAADILEACRGSSGFALVAGVGDEQLLAALAEQSRLQILGTCAEANVRDSLRNDIVARGLYGDRITLHRDSIAEAGFQENVFNLVLVECDGDRLPEPPVTELVRLLQPYNGSLVIAFRGSADRERFAEWCGDIGEWRWESIAGGSLAVHHASPPLGSGEWSHPFADPGHSACSQDEQVRSPFEMQWFGPPGPEHMVDRHNRASPPLFKDGRLFIPGHDRITAVDAYNGVLLWEQIVGNSTRLAVSKNCGHVVVGPQQVYVAAVDQCHAFNSQTGVLEHVFRLPLIPDQRSREWGYLAITQETLLGSATQSEAARHQLTSQSWQMGYLDSTPLVTSESLFAYDAQSAQLLWQHNCENVSIINSTIAADSQRVYYVQSGELPPDQNPTGRLTLPKLLANGAILVARDMRSGELLWSRSLDMKPQHSLFLSVVSGRIVVAASRNEGNNLVCELSAFEAQDGERHWAIAEATGLSIGGSHGEQEQHPLIVGDSIFFKTFACNLYTGAVSKKWQLPFGGCGALAGSKHAAFFRAGSSYFADLKTGVSQSLTGVTRPGCWLNMLPAGGLLLAPESSAGCTCQYPIQTSLAMRPLAGPPPEVFMRSGPQGELVPLAGDLEFAGRIQLELATSADEQDVRFSYDGQWPTKQSSRYTEPLMIERSTVLWARGYHGRARSGIARRRLNRIESPKLKTTSEVFVTTARVEFASLPGEYAIHYRLDGISPDASSPVYSGPFEVEQSCVLNAAYFLDDARTGPDLTMQYRKVPGRTADRVDAAEPGLYFEYYEGDGWTQLPDFTEVQPLRSGDIPRFVIPKEHRPDGFAVRYQGFIDVPLDGMYTFFLRSDDGSELWIGDDILVSNNGIHDARGERLAEVPLAAGKHRIEVRYFDVAAGEVLIVRYAGPGFGKREIPTEVLSRVPRAARP